jgi:hypothetical protein
VSQQLLVYFDFCEHFEPILPNANIHPVRACKQAEGFKIAHAGAVLGGNLSPAIHWLRTYPYNEMPKIGNYLNANGAKSTFFLNTYKRLRIPLEIASLPKLNLSIKCPSKRMD